MKGVGTMGDRITRKDAEQALRVYCQRAGLPYGHYTVENDGLPDGAVYGDTTTVEQGGRSFTAHEYARNGGRHSYVITGGLALSCEYGGYQVQQILGMLHAIAGESPCTGVTTPFGGGIKSAREIYTMLRGAIEGLELAGC
jgi:hypothetical protein